MYVIEHHDILEFLLGLVFGFMGGLQYPNIKDFLNKF
jgi:hypothetical protein